QELTFPVLENGLPGVARGEIAGHRHGCVSMLFLFAVVLRESCDQLSREKQQKHRHQGQRQRSIAEPRHRRRSARGSLAEHVRSTKRSGARRTTATVALISSSSSHCRRLPVLHRL